MIDQFTEFVGTDIPLSEEAIRGEMDRRQGNLEKVAMKEVPEIYLESVKKSKQFIHELFGKFGISVGLADIATPIFISEEVIDTNSEPEGISNRLDKNPIVRITNKFSDIDYANLICHEMLHFSAKTVFSSSETSVQQKRQGMAISKYDKDKPESQTHSQWFFEEAFAYHFAAEFSESLKDDPLFSENYSLKRDKVSQLDSEGKLLDGKILDKDIDIPIEPKYVYMSQDKIVEEIKYGYTTETLTGSLFDLLLNKFTPTEQDELLGYFVQSRVDLKKIGNFARMINKKFGPGTYTRLSKCKRDDAIEMKSLFNEFSQK